MYLAAQVCTNEAASAVPVALFRGGTPTILLQKKLENETARDRIVLFSKSKANRILLKSNLKFQLFFLRVLLLKKVI